MAKKPLEEVVADKIAAGKDRIILSVSFNFTDPYELELLKYLWNFNHSIHIKRVLERDRAGTIPTANFTVPVAEETEEEDISDFL